MMGPWIASEHQRLTATLGDTSPKGPKLPLDVFLAFVPILLAVGVSGWLIEIRVPENLRYGLILVLIVLLLAVGCFILHREFRPSLGQFGLNSEALRSRNVGLWTLCGILFTAAERALPALNGLLGRYAGAPVLSPGAPYRIVEQAWSHLPSFLLFQTFLGSTLEELFFRGYLYLVLRQNLGDNAALLISSAIFGGLHGVPWFFFVSVFYIYFNNRANSLWPSMASHITYNASLLLPPG